MSVQLDNNVTHEEAEYAQAWVYEVCFFYFVGFTPAKLSLETDEFNVCVYGMKMYKLADSKSVGMVPTFMQEETVLNFASTSSLKGRAALERLYTWEYGACARIDHRLVR